jgi:hypothetical protein
MLHWFYWGAALVLAPSGAGIMASNFQPNDPWLSLGLIVMLAGVTMCNMGVVLRRWRTLDEEFEAGYRVGYRAGRRAPLVGAREEQHGRLPQASVRSLAGHRAAARRAATHPH